MYLQPFIRYDILAYKKETYRSGAFLSENRNLICSIKKIELYWEKLESMKFKHLIVTYFIFYSLFAFGQRIMDFPQLKKLPIYSVHRVFQDKEGYVWYGTSDGLCRDDGYNIHVFRSDFLTPNVMQSNLIWTIAEDNQNRIWYGTDKGAYILDKSTYIIHLLDYPNIIKNEKIITINSTSNGCMWVSTYKNLYKYLPDGKFDTFFNINIGNQRIEYFYEDADQNIWICIGNIGLCKLNRESKKIEVYSSAKGSVENFIIQDQSKKYYWVGTWGNGIARFNPNTRKDSMYVYQSATQKENDNRILSLIQDKVNNNIWAITYSSLLSFSINKKNMLEQVSTSHFLSQENKMLAEVISDKDKNLWISAYDQNSFILNLQDKIIKEYNLPSLRKRINGNPAIVSICKDEDNLLWISQDRYGLCLYSADSDLLIHYNDCSGTRNQALMIIPYIIKSKEKGKIWAMSEENCIYEIERINLSMNLRKTIDLRNITDKPGKLRTIYEDSFGNLWIGSTTGLYIYKASKQALEIVKEITGAVSGITETIDGSIWVCVNKKGVYKVTKDNKHDFYPNENDLFCIDATSDGKLWIGTYSGGVLLLDPTEKGIYKDYTQTCGMNGDIVETIIVDDLNHVWILTNQNVKEFNPRNNAYRNYSANGKSFLLNRFLPRSAFKDNNTIYFGGIPGFISLKSDNKLESIPKSPKTDITDITVGDKSLFFDTHISQTSNMSIDISPNSYNIKIDFSTLNYWNTSQIRYAYQLEGVDKEWIYISDGKNSAFYNRLSKGTYTFRVKATDENGLWSNDITEITINRLPAIYETTWAYIFYLLLVISTCWLILYRYMRRVKFESKKKYEVEINQLKDQLELLSPDIQFVQEVQSLIETNLSNSSFDVSSLADSLHTSRSTLTRRIKAVTGQTPLEFIRDIKMKYACQMLKQTDHSISDIATLLGYNDNKYFASIFKDVYNMTPSEYRKTNK